MAMRPTLGLMTSIVGVVGAVVAFDYVEHRSRRTINGFGHGWLIDTSNTIVHPEKGYVETNVL